MGEGDDVSLLGDSLRVASRVRLALLPHADVELDYVLNRLVYNSLILRRLVHFLNLMINLYRYFISTLSSNCL